MFDPHTNDTEYNDELDPDNNYFEALFPSLTSDETSNYVTIDEFFDLHKNFPDGLSIVHLNIRSSMLTLTNCLLYSRTIVSAYRKFSYLPRPGINLVTHKN